MPTIADIVRPSTPPDAHQRLTEVLHQHFHLIAWPSTDGEESPIITLVDPITGTSVTLTVLDPPDIDAPHILLINHGGRLGAYGPFDGEPAARRFAGHAARIDQRPAITRAVALLHPHQGQVPIDGWRPAPAPLARAAAPDTGPAPAAVVALLDGARGLVAAVGPFDSPVEADAWQPLDALPDGVRRVTLGMWPASWLRCVA